MNSPDIRVLNDQDLKFIMTNLIPIERIENKIYLIRGQKVMLDYDLAELYGVETKYLKRQVKRNARRFPKDFMFELTKKEFLRCQNVTSSYGGRRYLPYAFTEHGIAMLSSILKSEKAVQVNILIIRTFIELRKILSTHKALSGAIADLQRKDDKHDVEISAIFKVLKKLISIEERPKRKIGFLRDRGWK